MSKELEYLEEIKSYFPFVDLGKGKEYVCEKEFNVIKQALLKAEKEHKALEIIKEKECDIRWFKYCIKVNSEVETYNNGLPEYYEKLTQEEFNLLKEVLEWFLKCDHW